MYVVKICVEKIFFFLLILVNNKVKGCFWIKVFKILIGVNFLEG